LLSKGCHKGDELQHSDLILWGNLLLLLAALAVANHWFLSQFIGLWCCQPQCQSSTQFMLQFCWNVVFAVFSLPVNATAVCTVWVRS